MTSPTASVFGTQNHPSGQILVSRRDVSAKVNALAGYRVDVMAGRSLVSRIEQLHHSSDSAS
jgi:hypothetical protein